MLRRAVLLALALALIAPATASAGVFTREGDTIVYNDDGGDSEDKIAVFDAGSVIRLTKFGAATLGPGGPCRFSAGGTSVDCPKDGATTVILNLGGGNDVAAVNSNVNLPVILNGGDGDDGLFGGGGFDVFRGGAGNDNIISRDGRGEDVNCGDGNDTAISDDADTRTSCEEIEGDADGDGVRRPADCDDTNPAIRPGVTDIPDDGIDQDCSGTDATNLDADGDGSPRPQDCDDSNPRIHPGAREIAGNGVDENCDSEIVPFRGLGGIIRNVWLPFGGRTINSTLSARELPKGTRIELRCSGRGCAFRKVVRRVKSKRAVNLHGAFKGRALSPGAKVELRLTRSGRIGRVLRFRVTSTPGVPRFEFKCKPPGRGIRDC